MTITESQKILCSTMYKTDFFTFCYCHFSSIYCLEFENKIPISVNGESRHEVKKPKTLATMTQFSKPSKNANKICISNIKNSGDPLSL